MTEQKTTGPRGPRDDANWAQPVDRLRLSRVPSDAINLNVEGRQVVGPLQGFGQMWQKTYKVRLAGADVSPNDLVRTWKENFASFWPGRNRYYAPLTGIAPGEVALINLDTAGGVKLSTGVLVIYADDESFTFMTPEGHMFSGWITFSAYWEDEATVAQTQVLIRANDPFWEIAMRLFGFRKEDQFWERTMANLASHYGVVGQVSTTATCVDPRIQWSRAGNIWHNAFIRSALYALAAPARAPGALLRKLRS